MTDVLSAEAIVSYRICFRGDVPHEKEPLPAEQWFEDGVVSADNFYFLFVPDAPSTADLRKKTEARLNELRDASGEPAIELFSKPYRIVWHPPHAAILGGDRLPEEMFSAFVEFASLENRLRKLEAKTADCLNVCAKDVPLTHAVSPSDLRRQTHVNKMTEQIVSSQMELVCLTPCFDNLCARLTPQTKHAIEELTEKMRVWDDRIETLEDQLESLWDLYELANDRLTEFSYFKREALLELWIIALLVLELVVMFWEALALSRG